MWDPWQPQVVNSIFFLKSDQFPVPWRISSLTLEMTQDHIKRHRMYQGTEVLFGENQKNDSFTASIRI